MRKCNSFQADRVQISMEGSLQHKFDEQITSKSNLLHVQYNNQNLSPNLNWDAMYLSKDSLLMQTSLSPVNPLKNLFMSQTPGSTASAQESLPQMYWQPFGLPGMIVEQSPLMQNKSEAYPGFRKISCCNEQKSNNKIEVAVQNDCC